MYTFQNTLKGESSTLQESVVEINFNNSSGELSDSPTFPGKRSTYKDHGYNL